MHNEFTYVVEGPTDEDAWYVAYCPEVPEANGQGKTEADAVANLKEAIALVLNCRREEGLRGVPATAKRGVVAVP